MPAPRPANHPAPDDPDPIHEIACELLGILPFGARADALTRCPRLTERIDAGRPFDGRGAAAVVDAIESFTGALPVEGQPEPLPAELVRHMLHVLLATRDLGWPGTDAPLSVRRVAAADLYFDATQTVLSDHDWKGPNGVEFALLTALAGRVCHAASLRALEETASAAASASWDDECRARDIPGETLGRLRRVQRPRGL
ncbi:MAG: hypothetical protein QOK35_3098 [Pseudonocardiales bacterium]|jgi:hypothetical protein|nr:hypothetical protein [Pseudonocardiales bacterium]